MPKPILDYRDDDSPLWPARCRGYLEGRQASDCLASVELARLRAEKEALLAENNDLRREWLHTVSHDVVFTAEVNGEHGIDLSKMPISEATLAALNIGIDRENYRLRAENERLRAALVDAQGYGEMLERVLLPFSNFAVAFLNNVSDGHWPEASGSTTRWQGMTAGTEITFGDLANAAAALKDVPCP